MIPKSGNRFSEKIMRKQKHIRMIPISGNRFSGDHAQAKSHSHDPEKWEPVFGEDHA
jgi:hypothetical protein